MLLILALPFASAVAGTFTVLTYNVAGLPLGLSGSTPEVNNALISPRLTGPPLVYPRRSHAVVATPDGKLYAIGGFVAPREKGLRDQLLGAKVDPELGATVEVLDTRVLAGK